jgi:acyl carrier protein
MSTPANADILGNVSAILCDQMGVADSSAINEQTLLFADLGLASIDAVVLSEALQKHYNRALPFQELLAEVGRKSKRDLSIGELIAFLATRL